MKKLIKRLNIKSPSKKFWAREILIIIILAVISTSAYFINENRNSNIRNNMEKTETELKVIQNKIDGYGGAFFENWMLLKEYGAFEGDYESFKKEYGDYSKSNILHKLTRNNGIETGHSWYKRMYTKGYHLKRLYISYTDICCSKWYPNVGIQFREFSKTEMSFSAFTDMLYSNEDFLKLNYQNYIIGDNYDWSIERLKKTISTDTHIVDSDKYFSLLPTLKLKQSELNKLKDSGLRYIDEYILIFILFVYGLRVFVSIIRWSIKQLS
jgi:hypothetical protein